MSTRSIGLSASLYDWLLRNTVREAAPLQRLREATAELPDAGMQISPEQGQLMALLTKLTGAKRVLEIGTFTGYSTLVVALAMPAHGRIITCDVDADTTAIAMRHWQAAGVADKIELQLAPALQTIESLLAAGAAGTFDLAFIDADEESYPAYYEHCMSLVRAGGLILLDNMLWNGSVADPRNRRASTRAIRALTKTIKNDARVDCVLVPIGDGLMIARKLG